MEPAERLAKVQQELASLDGTSEKTYRLLTADLSAGKPGGEDQLRVAVFGAKEYDSNALKEANEGRFSIDFFAANLDLDTVQMAREHDAVCIFVAGGCDAQVVASLAHLGIKLIALRCAGFNNVDLSACARNGIDVVRVPAYSSHAVADFAVGLMLTLNRRLHISYARTRVDNFDIQGLTGFDMYGKTVGVIGAGRIGTCVIDILTGFGCHILAYTPHLVSRNAALANLSFVDIDDVLAGSDIVTLHAPLTPSTIHIIDAAAISKMKPGVMIINTSRGGLIDKQALIDAWESGQVGGAGLDVYEGEAGAFYVNFSRNDLVMSDDLLGRLLRFPNVMVTAHQSFLAAEALINIANTTLDSVADFTAGKRGADLTNVV
jgi:D-lactate dehydrogenase